MVTFTELWLQISSIWREIFSSFPLWGFMFSDNHHLSSKKDQVFSGSRLFSIRSSTKNAENALNAAQRRLWRVSLNVNAFPLNLGRGINQKTFPRNHFHLPTDGKYTLAEKLNSETLRRINCFITFAKARRSAKAPSQKMETVYFYYFLSSWKAMNVT